MQGRALQYQRYRRFHAEIRPRAVAYSYRHQRIQPQLGQGLVQGHGGFDSRLVSVAHHRSDARTHPLGHRAPRLARVEVGKRVGPAPVAEVTRRVQLLDHLGEVADAADLRECDQGPIGTQPSHSSADPVGGKQ
ncbi:Uncharacterised protein [Mycobacterium tuberculosis]|nr:Uncharacterised protein [Mycobacterium tuberculosis]